LAGALPATACAIYLVDRDGASLYTASIAGEVPWAYLNKRTDFGRRICGWVAANKVTALNSIADLDFDEAGGAGGLKASLVSPLLFGQDVVGVVGFYSRTANGFSKAHQSIVEEFARIVVRNLRSSINTRPTESAPTALAQLISKVEGTSSWWPVGVVVIRFEESPDSSEFEDDIRKMLREAVRVEDSLLRVDRDAYLLLLLRSNNSTTREVAGRLQEQLAASSTKAVIEWASVDRGPNSENQAFNSLADAIRHTALDSSRGNTTAH